MDYELNEDDVFSLSSGDYVVLDKYNKDGVDYYFCNKLKDEETPSEEFTVFKGLVEGLVTATPEDDIEDVVKVFNDRLNKKIEIIRASMDQEG